MAMEEPLSLVSLEQSEAGVVTLIEVNQSSSMATINRLPITKARINLGQIARRAHNGNEYFILEKDGIPVIGIMAADELEDYVEQRDAKVKASIATSRRDRAKGRTRPAGELLRGLKRSAARKTA
jgi:antitoxin (DNA-binding transcriptional repressor) of toxin-antitoxin stability system